MIHLLNALHKTTLTFSDKVREKGDVWTFSFTPDTRPKHIAGQHAAFIIKGAGYHVFSLANAPEEETVKIGTHVREGSKFKQALAALQPGDTITMYGPILNFTFENAPHDVVFLSQGIGITPFRSLLIHNAHQTEPRPITLIHSDAPDPAYRSTLEPLTDAAFYPENPEAFTTDLTAVIAQKPNARYYLSGSPRFISATKETLKAHGIAADTIKTDQFWGYKN